MKNDRTIRRTSQNRFVVRESGKPPYVAARCISCMELQHTDLIRESGDCARCERSNAA